MPRLRIGGNGPGGNGGFDIQRIGDATLLRIDGDGRLGIKEKNPDLRLTIDQQGLGLNNPSSQTLAFHSSSRTGTPEEHAPRHVAASACDRPRPRLCSLR